MVQSDPVNESASGLRPKGDPAFGLYDPASGRLLYANAEYVAILRRAGGREQRDPAGQTWEDCPFVLHPDSAGEVFARVLRERAPIFLSRVSVLAMGTQDQTAWNVCIAPLFSFGENAEGPVQYVLISGEEITEHVRAVRELQERDRLKDEFLSLVTHELRAPLVPLIGHAEMLGDLVRLREKEGEDWASRIDWHLDKILKQVQRMDRLIDDLADLTRLQSGKFSLEWAPLPVGEIVEQAIEEARMQSPSKTIGLQISGQPAIIRGDRGRLMQVVSNLLSNAITHAPKSERIDVRLIRKGPRQGEMGLPAEVQIEVQDYGPGIPPEDQTRIFSRFYQVSQKKRPGQRGLGLGLFIAREIVEQHGGTIEVNSVVGKGCTFVVRFPLRGDAD